MNKNITLYTTTLCGVCALVRDFLTTMNIDYKEINVDLHPIEMVKLIGKTGRFSVPQANINGEWVFGFDPVRIIEALNTILD